MHCFRRVVIAGLLAALHTHTSAAGDPARGEQIYAARCGGCHSIEENRIGPRHQGVVGRRAGSVEGFDYSKALRKSNITWTPAQLDRWLTNPEQLVPGQRMSYRLSDEGERADVIAYLGSLPSQ